MKQVADYTQIKWQCRRGMLELDLLLGSFLDNCYAQLTISQQQIFIRLLQASDTTLYSWLFNQEAVPDAELSGIIKYIIEHYRNLSRKV